MQPEKESTCTEEIVIARLKELLSPADLEAIAAALDEVLSFRNGFGDVSVACKWGKVHEVVIKKTIRPNIS